MSRVLVSTEWLQHLIGAAEAFCSWFDDFDPEQCSTEDVRTALSAIAGLEPLRRTPKRPDARMSKPSERWQRNQRKAVRLSINGYRTPFLPNDDGTASVLCSLAYDLCDLYEICQSYVELSKDAVRLPRLVLLSDWEYMALRMKACGEALARAPHNKVDPFQRLKIRGRLIRFVGWSRTFTLTHATEDGELTRGASTLCGGRLAFHKHTQQQWTCYACPDCRHAVDGTVPSASRRRSCSART